MPTKRLVVYIAAGLIVLVVGTLGVVSMRGGAGAPAGDLAMVTVDSEPGTVSTGSQVPAPSTTSTTETPLIYVQVAGAVRRPGVYQVSSDARVFEAVLQAGGFTEEADQQSVPLASRLTDGCRVYVPRVGEQPPAPGALSPPGQPSAVSGDAPAVPVSLNSATLEQLDSLPGIGPATAQNIILYRDTHGPFTSVDQLSDVSGIGPAKLEKLRPLVTL